MESGDSDSEDFDLIEEKDLEQPLVPDEEYELDCDYDLDLEPPERPIAILGDIIVDEKKEYVPEERAPSIYEDFRKKFDEIKGNSKLIFTNSDPSRVRIDKILKKYNTFEKWKAAHPNFVEKGFDQAWRILYKV